MVVLVADFCQYTCPLFKPLRGTSSMAQCCGQGGKKPLHLSLRLKPLHLSLRLRMTNPAPVQAHSLSSIKSTANRVKPSTVAVPHQGVPSQVKKHPFRDPILVKSLPQPGPHRFVGRPAHIVRTNAIPALIIYDPQRLRSDYNNSGRLQLVFPFEIRPATASFGRLWRSNRVQAGRRRSSLQISPRRLNPSD